MPVTAVGSGQKGLPRAASCLGSGSASAPAPWPSHPAPCASPGLPGCRDSQGAGPRPPVGGHHRGGLALPACPGQRSRARWGPDPTPRAPHQPCRASSQAHIEEMRAPLELGALCPPPASRGSRARPHPHPRLHCGLGTSSSSLSGLSQLPGPGLHTGQGFQDSVPPAAPSLGGTMLFRGPCAGKHTRASRAPGRHLPSTPRGCLFLTTSSSRTLRKSRHLSFPAAPPQRKPGRSEAVNKYWSNE